ncbi:MAG: GDSL-type esterase/lipase family protein [Planctomycetota bacterium]
MSTSPRPQRGRSRAILVLIAVTLGTLLLLETVLQAGAAVVWLSQETPATTATADDRATILCVGDSFTYGAGTTAQEFAYPAQLQSLLREGGRDDIGVVSCALPGRNSREALEQLDAQLVRYRPSLVYVMIGRNDQWSKPARLELPEYQGGVAAAASVAAAAGRSSFRWEFRTVRLGKWLLGHLRGGGDAGSGLPPGTPPAAAAAPGATVATPATATPAPGAAPDPVVSNPWEAIRMQRPDIARRMWEDALVEQPENPWAHAGLVTACRGLGDAAAAEQHVDWLRELVAEKPSAPAAGALVGALQAMGADHEALEVARAQVEQFPKSAQLWEAIAWVSFQNKDLDTARDAIDRALAHIVNDPGWRANVLRRHSIIWRSQDRQKSLRSYTEALVVGGIFEKGGWGVPTCTREELREILAEFDVAPEKAKRVEQFMAKTLGWDGSEFEATLRDHLRQIVEHCRAAGSRPVLMTYPVPFAWVESTVPAVANAQMVPWIHVVPKFVERLAGADSSDYFVPDGHCSDAGYGMLAQIVAEDAAARMTPGPGRR